VIGCATPVQVVSLGDSRSYYLSTAKPEHGVVYALSEHGVAMVPISYHEMQCPVTKAKMDKKVARIDFDALALPATT
jgi:exosome complex component CSL4